MKIEKMPIGMITKRKLFALTEPFSFYTDILNMQITIPSGFVCDFESIPLLRGLCRTGGIIHDYLCRIDSEPLVSKKVAANIYREALIYFKHSSKIVRIKYWTVRIVPGYFHKKWVLEIE